MALPAHVQVANLVARYAEAMDLGDFDAVAGLFADGVVTSEGSDRTFSGPDEVLRLFTVSTRCYTDDGTPHTKHLTTNLILDIEGEVTSLAAFFVGQALISGHAPHAALGDPGVARAVVGTGLLLTALAVLSVAAGTLLRHPAAAITCMIAVLFVLPGIAQALPDSWRNPVTEFWPTQAGGQLTDVYRAAHTLQPWPGFGVMCLFTAIVYAIAWTPLDRRDA